MPGRCIIGFGRRRGGRHDAAVSCGQGPETIGGIERGITKEKRSVRTVDAERGHLSRFRKTLGGGLQKKEKN